jgi:hypothetical protein
MSGLPRLALPKLPGGASLDAALSAFGTDKTPKVPLEPLKPRSLDANRAVAEIWRKIAEMRAHELDRHVSIGGAAVACSAKISGR